MMKQHSPPLAPLHQQTGVVLLEVLISFLIFSLGILGLVGLQGTMVKNTTDAQYRSEATLLAQQRIGQMWADTCNLASYAGEETLDDAVLPNGRILIEHWGSAFPCGQERTTVTITWMLPGDGDPNLDRNDPRWRRIVQTVSISDGTGG